MTNHTISLRCYPAKPLFFSETIQKHCLYVVFMTIGILRFAVSNNDQFYELNQISHNHNFIKSVNLQSFGISETLDSSGSSLFSIFS